MKNLILTVAFLFTLGYASAQTEPQKSKKADTTTVQKTTTKKEVKTKDQKKVIRKSTEVKSDTVMRKPNNP